MEVNTKRMIQPVAKTPKTEINLSNHSLVDSFNDHLQECLKAEDTIDGAEVLRKVKYSYDKLYQVTRVQPNAVAITPDYLAAVQAECLTQYHTPISTADQLFGMDIVLLAGRGIVRACIMDKEG